MHDDFVCILCVFCAHLLGGMVKKYSNHFCVNNQNTSVFLRRQTAVIFF